MRYYIRVLSLVSILCFAACQRTNTFYNRRTGFDYIRIPFIKPYEAILLNGKKDWIMNLHNEGLTSSVINIKKVSVIKQMVLLQCKNANIDGITVKDAWFVIIPSRHIEKGFSTHIDYLRYLNQNGIGVEPKLYDINFVSTQFIDHYPINWEHIE